ncbi:polycystin-1-like protein 2 isoform X3 [Clavelina lepadiformis]|uniref:polycystin-1-like protein 2 isoform X3 n=1 Tax=Clavelina lepadiformis TaxID=159417 RepID=UPI0040424AC2
MWCIEGGSSPDWYLERMDIRDLETNECRFFLCGTKFSDVLEDTVRAATLEELQVSNKLFLLKHVWYSIYGRDHGSITS